MLSRYVPIYNYGFPWRFISNLHRCISSSVSSKAGNSDGNSDGISDQQIIMEALQLQIQTNQELFNRVSSLEQDISNLHRCLSSNDGNSDGISDQQIIMEALKEQFQINQELLKRIVSLEEDNHTRLMLLKSLLLQKNIHLDNDQDHINQGAHFKQPGCRNGSKLPITPSQCYRRQFHISHCAGIPRGYCVSANADGVAENSGSNIQQHDPTIGNDGSKMREAKERILELFWNHFYQKIDESISSTQPSNVSLYQDASASAYQIMSYLLMNEEMGRQTNLIPSPDNKIQDMYVCLQHELLQYLRQEQVFNTSKYSIIKDLLTRKVVKQLFMPIIYGKTVLAMARDLREVYGSLLRSNEFYSLAKACYDFWAFKYPDIINLMRFINLIGGFCSDMGQPVLYSIPYFTTVQDYMRSNTEYIWVYDRICNKRHRVSLKVPTSDRDSRKTKVATCVNFIHQKDAYIAMKVVKQLTLQRKPVYTVHDNFITTAVSAAGVAEIYTKVFMEMGPPLRIINEFILLNLIQSSGGASPFHPDWVNDPIPGDELQTLLISLEPQDLKNKNWSKKVKEAVSCYEKYVNTVCGGQPHAEKWNSFHSILNGWESLGFNYSVHY